MMPKLAVITVTYNSIDQLRLTVESVRAQGLPSLEYIIVDGNSTDGTPAYLEANRDVITAYVSDPDSGIYDAMNKGLALASADFVHFLNAGDVFIGNGKLAKLLPLLDETVDLLECQVVAVDPVTNGETIFPKPTRTNGPREKFHSAYCHQALIIRRQRYLDLGGFSLAYRHFADFAIVSVIASQLDRVKVKSEPIVRFRLDGVSSDWRKAPLLYLERERLLTDLGDGSGSVAHLLGLVRSHMYRAKRALLARF